MDVYVCEEKMQTWANLKRGNADRFRFQNS